MRIGRRRSRRAGPHTGTLAALVLALAVTTAELGAQARVAEPAVVDVVGTVVDDAGRPLAGAFVSLDGSDRGVLSDERGRFRIPDLDAGRVVLRVEQLGHADLVWAGVVGSDPRPLVLALEPRPVMLEGLTVVTDRFRARRNAVATAVRAWERADLATSPYETAARFIAARAGLATVPCRAAHSTLCVWSRGRAVSPTVYVDEAPIFGGMEYLDALPPHELHLVEVYGNGRHIRAYTEQFMERAARIRLQPVAFLR